MTPSTLGRADVGRRLRKGGLTLRTGPFAVRLRSPLDAVADGVADLYSRHPVLGDDEFADFEVRLERGTGLRRWFRPQARFVYDGVAPFEPLPIGHAMPLLEWAMNWCISTQAHQYLVLHAASIERDGVAAILPAPPGSGKSTLCAGLVCRGWRLLSDELTLISPQDRSLTALCRPVSLKNQSLDVIRAFAPEAEFGAPVHDTAKGTVNLMKVPAADLERVAEPARAGFVVFPRFVRDAAPRLTDRSRANSMLELARNAFNYTLLGKRGFDTLADVIDACDCYDFEYSRLDDAVELFDLLAKGARR